eukprot:7375891-Prymnesium_polylepis.1
MSLSLSLSLSRSLAPSRPRALAPARPRALAPARPHSLARALACPLSRATPRCLSRARGAPRHLGVCSYVMRLHAPTQRRVLPHGRVDANAHQVAHAAVGGASRASGLARRDEQQLPLPRPLCPQREKHAPLSRRRMHN